MYFYRVFAAVDKNIWGEEIEKFVQENKLGFDVYGVVEEDKEEDLDAVPVSLVLMDADRRVAEIFYDKLESSDVLKGEIEEFHEFVDVMEPAVNRAWAHEQLNKTVACYAIAIEKAGFEIANWDKLSVLASWLRDETQGIEQSDSGLITNENGAVILDVPDDVDLDDEDDDYEDDEDMDEEGPAEIEFEEEFDEDEFVDDDEEDDEDEEEDDEEDEEWDEFEAAIREGDGWNVRLITSEEERQEFLRGNA